MQQAAEFPRFLIRLVDGSRVEHEQRIDHLRQTDLGSFLCPEMAVLDLANGRLRPQFTLLQRLGYRVYGVDLANRPTTPTEDWSYVIARRLYAWRLAPPVRKPDALNLVCGDVASLPFRSESFDLVTSVAAFEHFLDVPAALSEISRVLRPNGLVWVLIHLFSSLSGGHNLTRTQVPLRQMPTGAEPWDHLRHKLLPLSVPLNRWRRDQYVEALSKQFRIIKVHYAFPEGVELLTPSLLGELSDYDPDELTHAAWIVLAAKT